MNTTQLERLLREAQERNKRLVEQNVELQNRVRELSTAMNDIFKIAVKAG